MRGSVLFGILVLGKHIRSYIRLRVEDAQF